MFQICVQLEVFARIHFSIYIENRVENLMRDIEKRHQ